MKKILLILFVAIMSSIMLMGYFMINETHTIILQQRTQINELEEIAKDRYLTMDAPTGEIMREWMDQREMILDEIRDLEDVFWRIEDEYDWIEDELELLRQSYHTESEPILITWQEFTFDLNKVTAISGNTTHNGLQSTRITLEGQHYNFPYVYEATRDMEYRGLLELISEAEETNYSEEFVLDMLEELLQNFARMSQDKDYTGWYEDGVWYENEDGGDEYKESWTLEEIWEDFK